MRHTDEFCFRRALELYPSLARAVPPKPLNSTREGAPLRCGPYPHAVQNPFWRDHMSESRLRECTDPTAVIGPIEAHGSCLEPLHVAGDLLWFDPTLPAQPGDVVLFIAPPGLDDETRNLLNFRAKVLVEFANEYFLAFNEGMYPLGNIRILGVEVRRPSALPVSDHSTLSVAAKAMD